VRDYSTYCSYSAEIGGATLKVTGKPGVWSWDGLNPGSRALIEAAEISSGDRVVDLGCGAGPIGLWAAICGARTVLVDTSLPAVECARRTVLPEYGDTTDVLLADGVGGLGSASFDQVLSHLPRVRAVQEELIDGAHAVLRPGGLFTFVGATRSGIKGAVRYAATRFGRCAVVRQKQGYHVAIAERTAADSCDPCPAPYQLQRFTCGEREYTVAGKPGVFAWDRLDGGTAALINAMEITPGDRVLDLGCGTGLVGLVAGIRAESGPVVLVDSDLRAVGAARRTLKANGVSNGTAMISDCAQAVYGQQFDVVVTNPPFHRGIGTEYDVAYQFVRDARSVLRPGGRLYLVANRHIRYVDHIRSVFDGVSTVFADNRYQVIRARAA
jgi:16S rRNA (guanine1207-N2)-methyltransferase